MTMNLPCGHHESLRVTSVESGTSWCELCETRDRLRDALTAERFYRDAWERAKEYGTLWRLKVDADPRSKIPLRIEFLQ